MVALANLGPTLARLLPRAGITTAAELEALGPIRAYVRCALMGNDSKVMLYALLGAELDLHGNDVPADIKTAALAEAAARLRSHEEGLLHIVSQSDWNAVDDEYVPDSLDAEGFIHCSTRQTVLGPANALYAGRGDLILLDIEPDRVKSRIAFEDSYGSGTEYPHIYGPLPRWAVTRQLDLSVSQNGTFQLPVALADR